MTSILLGTVALEPNRWATVGPDRHPAIRVSEWLPAIAEAGFDGVELWEPHLTEVDDDEVARILATTVPIRVFNSYVSFDTDDSSPRSDAAAWVHRSGADAVKYNVGNDPEREGLYVERVAAWLSEMPTYVRLLCECHVGISIAEQPAVAARIFDAIGATDRVQAIVHVTSEQPDHIRSRFDAYGERIGHIHVNDPPGWDERGALPLSEMRPELEQKIALVRSLGFEGTWTIEFVHGTLTGNDEPSYLLERAAEDLAVLRDLLA